MNLEDRLRDGLRGAGGSAEPPPWSAIRARASARRRRRRALTYPLVGLVTVAVLVGGVVAVASVRNGDDGGENVTAGPTDAAPPQEIVAVTDDGRLVVLASDDGRELRTLAQGVTTLIGESNPVPASPDGRTVYFTRDFAGNAPCNGVTEVARADLVTGEIEGVAFGARYPALSPDGRALALTSNPNSDCATSASITVTDLASGNAKQFTTDLPLSSGGIAYLSWAPDSRHLTYTLLTESEGSFPRVIDTETETSLDQAPRIFNWDGSRIQNYLGDTGDFLGTRCAGGTELIQDVHIVSFDPAGAVDRTLFRLPEQCVGQTTAPDPTGRHVLAIGLDPQALYRWSEGDTDPIRIAEGITAAAWLPASATQAAEPAPSPEVERRCGSEVPFRPGYLPAGFRAAPVPGMAPIARYEQAGASSSSPAVTHYTNGADRFIEIHHPGTPFLELVGRDEDFPNVTVLGRRGTFAAIAPTLSEQLIVQFSLVGDASGEPTTDPCDLWSLDGFGVTESELRAFAEGLQPTP